MTSDWLRRKDRLQKSIVSCRSWKFVQINVKQTYIIVHMQVMVIASEVVGALNQIM